MRGGGRIAPFWGALLPHIKHYALCCRGRSPTAAETAVDLPGVVKDSYDGDLVVARADGRGPRIGHRVNSGVDTGGQGWRGNWPRRYVGRNGERGTGFRWRSP